MRRLLSHGADHQEDHGADADRQGNAPGNRSRSRVAELHGGAERQPHDAVLRQQQHARQGADDDQDARLQPDEPEHVAPGMFYPQDGNG